MITAGVFTDLASAELALSTLEAEGIHALIPNEHLIGVDWQVSNAVGGIVVQVAPEDIERARAVLAVSRSSALPEEPEPGSYGPMCPKCGSNGTHPDPNARRMVALSLLFPPVIILTGPAYFFARGRFECSACGTVWRPRPSPVAA